MLQSLRVRRISRLGVVLALGLLTLLPALDRGTLRAEGDPAPASSPGWADLGPILPEGTDLTGHAVYLDFWASWCPPCRKSFPWMADTARKFGPAGLEVIAVCMDKDPKKAEAFLQAQGEIPFRIVYDPKGEVARKYDLAAMPTSLLFAPDGKLLSRHEGFLAKDAEALLEALAQIYPNAVSEVSAQP